jgi:hypothetical protein
VAGLQPHHLLQALLVDFGILFPPGVLHPLDRQADVVRQGEPVIATDGNPHHRPDHGRLRAPLPRGMGLAAQLEQLPFLAAILAPEIGRRVQGHQHAALLQGGEQGRVPVVAGLDAFLVEERRVLVLVQAAQLAHLLAQVGEELPHGGAEVGATVAEEEVVGHASSPCC